VPASRKIGRSVMSAEIIERTKAMIYDGSLKGGQRIPQELLAEELGVSRVPVREALIALESDGLVASEPHRGMYVVPISAEDIRDHYSIYGMVQGLAAAGATRHMSADAIVQLDGLVEKMDSITDQEALRELNWQFHALVNRTGGSKRTRSVLRQLARSFPREISGLAAIPVAEANQEHRLLVAAIRNRDAERADAISRQHVRAEGEQVVATLAERGVLED
jgi:DNA-binding GntR family transcriptional regulator